MMKAHAHFAPRHATAESQGHRELAPRTGKTAPRAKMRTKTAKQQRPQRGTTTTMKRRPTERAEAPENTVACVLVHDRRASLVHDRDVRSSRVYRHRVGRDYAATRTTASRSCCCRCRKMRAGAPAAHVRANARQTRTTKRTTKMTMTRTETKSPMGEIESLATRQLQAKANESDISGAKTLRDQCLSAGTQRCEVIFCNNFHRARLQAK